MNGAIITNTFYVLALCFFIIFGSIQPTKYLEFAIFINSSLVLGAEYRTQIYDQTHTGNDGADDDNNNNKNITQESSTNNIRSKMSSDDLRQFDCMATAVWFEARGESLEGQAAVIRVILNRVHAGFARTPCEVVEQVFYKYNPHTETFIRLCQFDYYCKKNWQNLITANSDIFKNIVNLVYSVVKHNEYSDIIPEHVVYFHSVHIRPNWLYRKFDTIGNHVFYTDPKLLKTKLNTQ